MTAGRNWAGTIEYSAAALARPRTVEQVQELIAGTPRVRALGSRHSFSPIADTRGTLVALDALDTPVAIDARAATVTVGAGTRYGELAPLLHEQGWALPNLASLPHISVAGAVATATHGSGVGLRNLASSVRSVDLVVADGSVRTIARGNTDFPGAVVNLGALGVVIALTLDIEPTYDVAVTVHQDLAWDDLLRHFDEILGRATSVSVFTGYDSPGVDQVWFKQRTDLPTPAGPLYGAVAATRRLHPLPGIDPAACTEQLGIPGPWLERLPHFRLDFTPSNGAEIQSEYLLPRTNGPAAIEALRGIGHLLAPLLQISEIRTVAADEAWLSTAFEQDSVAFHFTWKLLPGPVSQVLTAVESALLPLGGRPHWGKVFRAEPDRVTALYPRLGDFRDLVARLDPERKFANEFLTRYVLGN